jgi:hypothetical protein
MASLQGVELVMAQTLPNKTAACALTPTLSTLNDV